MITRRSLLRGAGAVGLGAALAGCAGGTTAPPQASTRTITHKLGTTEISGTPQRVVTMGLTEQDPTIPAGRTGLLAARLEDGTYYAYAEGPRPRSWPTSASPCHPPPRPCSPVPPA